MKHHYSIGIALAVFMLVNTAYFWEKWVGPWLLPFTLLLLMLVVALVTRLVLLLFRLIKHRFAEPHENRAFIILFAIQALTLSFPNGLIDVKTFESQALVSAQREGVANCRLYLHLKEGGEFVKQDICFGVSDEQGRYQIKGDSIFFHFGPDRAGIAHSAFGLIVNDPLSKPLSRTMLYFNDQNDRTPLRLEVFKYDLAKR